MGGDGGEKQTDVTNGGDDGRNGGADGAVGVADGGMFLQNSQARWGEGGRLNANCFQICPALLDGNPVVSVGVSKVCTDTLVFIGYGAIRLKLKNGVQRGIERRKRGARDQARPSHRQKQISERAPLSLSPKAASHGMMASGKGEERAGRPEE